MIGFPVPISTDHLNLPKMMISNFMEYLCLPLTNEEGLVILTQEPLTPHSQPPSWTISIFPSLSRILPHPQHLSIKKGQQVLHITICQHTHATECQSHTAGAGLAGLALPWPLSFSILTVFKETIHLIKTIDPHGRHAPFIIEEWPSYSFLYIYMLLSYYY